MPPATLTPPADSKANQGSSGPVAPLVPFTRASMHKTEFGNLDHSAIPTTSALPISTVDVPASGYLRSIWLQVDATNGAGAAAVLQPDAPWSFIQSITLRDINGAPIVGPITGYELFLLNNFGGYSWRSDPTLLSGSYTAPATTGNFRFGLRIPVQIRDRDALGALPNMNAAANYQLEVVRAPLIDVWSTNPSTVPSVRVTAIAETWTMPPAANAMGQGQATQPPALGTTQFWSPFRPSIASGEQTVGLKRVGNHIRNLIVVGRTAAGARSDAVLPENFRLSWDTRIIKQETLAYRKALVESIYGITPPTGVLVLPFCHDFSGHAGEEMGDQYLPTVQSSRLEIGGTVTTAGTWTVLTNDIAPNGNIWGS